MTEMVRRFNLGPHFMEVRAPDVVLLEWHGTVEPEHFLGIVALADEHCATWPWILIMVDERDLGRISAESRKLVPQLPTKLRLGAIVSWGASPVQRAIARLIIKLIQLLRGGDYPIVTVDSEAAAQAFIEKRRVAMLANPEERKQWSEEKA
jgi:hypothetical protein